MALWRRKVFNRITGKMDRELEYKDYDHDNGLIKNRFLEMMHDSERNQKYYAALKKSIDELHAVKKEAHVLDIGTGSGMFAMMAVKCGADSVTACEANKPMARCAERVIADNNMANDIHLIMKRSTSIIVDKQTGDMKIKANVLVTDIFDSFLIGQHAIDVFNHAHSNLLTDDCIVIPSLATIYAQVFECDIAMAWNQPKFLTNLEDEILLRAPNNIIECIGDGYMHEIQLSQLISLQSNSAKQLSNTLELFTFDFNTKIPIEKERRKLLKRVSTGNGSAQVVFFWWQLQMDKLGEINISNAPFWAHPNYNDLQNEGQASHKTPIQNLIPWRDHWMQAMYYLPKELKLTKYQEYFLNANHNEFSFWFNISDNAEDAKKTIIETDPRYCSCSFHTRYSKTRIGQLNQNSRNECFLEMLRPSINKTSNVLCFGEGSLIQLATAKLGAMSVTIVERFQYSRQSMESYANENKLDNVKFVNNVNALTELENFTHVICEPHFVTSVFPWDNFYFGTLLSSIQSKLNKNVIIMPTNAKLYAIPIEFLNLDKIQRPVGIAEGFNFSAFDIFIRKSCTRTPQTKVETHPLWEYPGRALGKPENLLNVDFKNYRKNKKATIRFDIAERGSLNGVGIWVDWHLDGSDNPKSIVTTGPNKQIEVGKFISWDKFVHQGVVLIPNAIRVRPGFKFNLDLTFEPLIGKMSFNFDKF